MMKGLVEGSRRRRLESFGRTRLFERSEEGGGGAHWSWIPRHYVVWTGKVIANPVEYSGVAIDERKKRRSIKSYASEANRSAVRRSFRTPASSFASSMSHY